MRRVLTIMAICFVVFLSACGDNAGSGTNAHLSFADSVQIADLIVNNYPDTVPGLKNRPSVFSYHTPPPLNEDDARKFHLDYLHNAGILDENKKIIHYLWISKADLKSLYDNSITGARLYFGMDKYETKEYLGIIGVPVDGTYQNILNNGSGQTLIINKLDPCPDQCPDTDDHNKQENNVLDLNYDKKEIYKKGKNWYKPNISKVKWVDAKNKLQ